MNEDLVPHEIRRVRVVHPDGTSTHTTITLFRPNRISGQEGVAEYVGVQDGEIVYAIKK